MSDDLPNCPFCGDKATLVNPHTGRSAVESDYCACDDQNCMPPYSMIPVKTWRKRPIEDALRAENERLRQALAWYAEPRHYLSPLDTMWQADYGQRARDALKEAE